LVFNPLKSKGFMNFIMMLREGRIGAYAALGLGGLRSLST
jgi:hypothetical protein